jgi:hypothetical protein
MLFWICLQQTLHISDVGIFRDNSIIKFTWRGTTSDTKIRRELRLLKAYALLSVVLFAVLIFLAAKSPSQKMESATYDTFTVQRINVMDLEGKLAMVLANHDDMPPSIWNGEPMQRHRMSSMAALSSSRISSATNKATWFGPAESTLTVHTRPLIRCRTTPLRPTSCLQVNDGNEKGKASAYMIGWNRPNIRTREAPGVLNELLSTKSESERQAIHAQHPEFSSTTLFLFGYDTTNTAQVMLTDAKSHPRVKMFVTSEARQSCNSSL